MSAVAGPREMGLSQRETFGHTLVELANENDRVVVLDGDLGTSTRTDIFADAHPVAVPADGDRRAEHGRGGGRPRDPRLDPIRHHLRLLRRRIEPSTRSACWSLSRALNVKIAGGYSGLLTGLTGKTHQVVDDIAVMRAMPHMTVIVPGDEEETRAAIRATAEQRGPVYLRLTRDPSPRLFDSDYEFELGRTHLLREGGDVGLISTGPQTARALEAAELLAADGIEAAVLHVPTIKPLDADALVAFASGVPRIVTAEDHTVLGGLGGAVAEVLGRRHPVPILRHGIADTFGESAPNDALLDKYRLSARWLDEAVRQFVKERS